MGTGWISIHRKLKECFIYADKPFDRTHAWIDLLLRANHQDRKICLGNQMIEVKRGSFITSELKLAEAWGWSKTKVRSFLLLLQNEKMIDKNSDQKKTTINIVNYDVYQDSETTEKLQKNHEKTTEKPQKNTNNNENNENNENKDNIYTSDSNEYRLANFLLSHIKKNNPKAKEPNLQTWSKQFDLLLKKDARDLEEIKSVIVFCQNNSFWKSNILSAKKLRDKYDTLYLQMKEGKNGGTKQNTSTGQSKFSGFKPKPKTIELTESEQREAEKLI